MPTMVHHQAKSLRLIPECRNADARIGLGVEQILLRRLFLTTFRYQETVSKSFCFIMDNSFAEDLLFEYQSARSLLATNEKDGILGINRVMDQCAQYSGAEDIVQKFIPEFIYDWVSRKSEKAMPSETESGPEDAIQR